VPLVLTRVRIPAATKAAPSTGSPTPRCTSRASPAPQPEEAAYETTEAAATSRGFRNHLRLSLQDALI